MSSPYTEIYHRLRSILEAVPAIRAGNKPGASRGKTSAAPADFLNAELRIRPAPGGSAVPRSSSSTGVYVQNFTVEIATDQQEPERLFEVKWAVIAALDDAGQTLGITSETFGVTRVDYADLADHHDNAELNRGQEYAWSSVITVSVEFRVKRDRLHTL